MTDLNLNELRKVAEAATPGPWEVADEGYDERYVYDSASGQMCWTPDLPGHWSLADATHIATFDPPTVLALLDRVAELEAKVARVEALAEEWEPMRWSEDGVEHTLTLNGPGGTYCHDLRAALAGESDE